MPRLKRFNYRELLAILRQHGITEDKRRGKGSERYLFNPQDPTKWYTIKCHGEGMQLAIGTLKAIQRRFKIPDDDFWK